MNKSLIVAVFAAILASGCGKEGAQSDSSSSAQSSAPQKAKVMSAWTRKFNVDPFDDKKKTLSFQTSAKEGGGYLLFLCEDNRIKFFWQYALSGKGPGMGMDMELIFRLDSDPTFNQEWGWSASQPLLYPKGDKTPFLNSMIGKSKLAIKSVIADSSYGVFDITGFDEAYNEIKTTCPSQ